MEETKKTRMQLVAEAHALTDAIRATELTEATVSRRMELHRQRAAIFRQIEELSNEQKKN